MNAMKSTKRLIKKYPNRRLYDTAVSQYVTLEALKDLIVQGVEFVVVSVRPKKDITHEVLLQIISEQEGKGKPLLTTQLLFHLIRFYGSSSQRTALGYYLEQCLFFFMEQQHQLTHQVDEWLAAFPQFSVWRDAYQNFYKKTFADTASNSKQER